MEGKKLEGKEEILERLKKAREKNAAFEEENKDREEMKELEKQAIFEENKARDLPHVKAAEDEHGVISIINTPLGAIVVKRPNHLIFNKFTKKASSTKGIDDMDIWRLVRPCIVYPKTSTVEKITEEYPGV